jgi:hypothetical protein
MLTARLFHRAALVVVASSTASIGSAQTLDFSGVDIRLAPQVTGAPYAADAVTSVTQVLADGTRIERRAEAKLFRDGHGRVRREQTIHGLAALDAGRESRVVVTIADPVAGVSYTLDPATRTARRTALSPRTFSGPPPPPPPPPPAGPVAGAPPPPPPPPPTRPQEESLGTATILGVPATGTRSVLTIPAGQVGNNRPLTVTSERWESTELRLPLRSVHDDPRTGRVEFRLVNLRRGEPSGDLFVVPAGYTVKDAPPPPPAAPPPPR